MGIELWEQRSIKKTNVPSLIELEEQVKNCTKCNLHQNRTHTVFARGDSKAKIMVIGEAPGYNEDQKGLPFVGKAGALLNKMLFSIGVNDKDVYIANVLKCRPPQNRDPTLEEISACSHYLIAQIKHVAPKIILGVGRFAGHFLLTRLFL